MRFNIVIAGVVILWMIFMFSFVTLCFDFFCSKYGLHLQLGKIHVYLFRENEKLLRSRRLTSSLCLKNVLDESLG